MKTKQQSRFRIGRVKHALLALVAGIFLLAFPGRAKAATIVDIAVGNSDFSTLVTAVQAASLIETLQGPGPFTVFAPNNAAFAKLPAETLNGLLQNPEKLRQVLLYHVVPGRVRSTDLVAGKVVTAQGAAVTVNLTGGVKVNDSSVIATDIEASNGIIHVIDTVLLPPPNIVEIAASNADFSTLVTAVQAASLVETLQGSGPFTVFAPNNAAFAKLPAETLNGLLQNPEKLRQILLYHVVPGRVRSTDLVAGKVVTAQGAAVTVNLTGGVTVNDSSVIATDIEASNGIIHVIDTVLLPPPNIVEIAASNPDFSTLVAAVQAAGLVDLLQKPRPFTVFAPNNAAFAKLPPGTVEALLADTNRLRTILLYHLVRGRVRSTDLEAGKVITVQGSAATVSLTGGVKVNESSVIAADIEASNGIIHVIDTVLLPPPNIVEIAASNPDFSTLVTAVQAAGLVETLQAAGPYTVFAPNNAAFAKLPPGALNALLADTNQLRHLLLYHLNHGPRLRAANLATGRIPTMQGAQANVTVSEAGVRINNSAVVAADIEAVNGIIHVIDTVLSPTDGFSGVELSLGVKAGAATVVWPLILGKQHVLESAVSVTGPWTATTNAVVIANGVNKTQLPSAGAQQYFRLREVPATE